MLRKLTLGFCLGLLALNVHAGGSGLNVAIIVNQNSTNSVQLGNFYRTQRNVPPQNYFRINWTGTNTEWTYMDFTNTLLNPFLSMLASRQLTNQIDYVVLSMDIPYRITDSNYQPNSTTSALFYGFQYDTNAECELASGSSNAYAGTEDVFRQVLRSINGSNYFMVTMITGTNLATAEMVVSQGAASDGTFPTETVWLAKSQDVARNVRFTEFDNTIFDTRLRGNYSVMRTNLGAYSSVYAVFPGLVLGLSLGNSFYNLSPMPLFPPGAMADNLTSYGGYLFEDTGQTSLLRFLDFGASGSYGTVTEPCDYLEKFPDSQAYFYQSRGFSLGECYYQSVTNIYQGLVVGEPLAAPFAKTGTGAWTGLASNAVLSGTTTLSGAFTASDAQHPLQQVDLFVDGCWVQTITNIVPQIASGNKLTVTLKGVPMSSSISSTNLDAIVSNLVFQINGISTADGLQIKAYQHGDRIELQSTAPYTTNGSQISVSVSSTNSSGPLTTFINTASAATNHFLDSTAQGFGYYTLSGTLATNATLTLQVQKTNHSAVNLTITNVGYTDFGNFATEVVNTINSTPGLQGPDGLSAADPEANSSEAIFDLQANGGGFAAAQIAVIFTPSIGLSISPGGTSTLTQNVSDLEPREHLYITIGATNNLPFSFPFITSNFADGYHALSAVAYEGSHVRTQTRATQDIIIKNSNLSATLTPVLSGSVSNLQPTLQITVTANTNNISSIQLFSTGGLLASATNQSSATFPIVLTNLDIGVHPFYAIVTQGNMHQYRTQTQNIGLIGVTYLNSTLMGVDYSFPLQISSLPPMLVWPATAGRSYTVLSTTNILQAFQPRATVVPTNSLGQWTETNAAPTQQFYRISITP
ncbi:MAG TPA: TIGR03790 family protein [Verrucomicrobiae bacterium]|nr:TIGR03790 family protein [Verrucomicrobiae bacterium]